MLIGVDGNEANVKRRVGSNQYAFGLLQALWRLDRDNQWLVYLRDRPLPDMPKERKNWHYRVIGPAKFWTQIRLPLDLYFHKPRPDIFFTLGHYTPRWSPVPVVVSIMDLGYLKFPEQFTKPIFYQLKTWTERSIKMAAHIFAISESTKNDIIKEYGLDPAKITVTYPGYDKARFKIQDLRFKIERVKEKYKIKGDYILFLGTLRPSKNIEGLIEAFAAVTRLHPVKLVIAGKKGWLFQSIFKKVKELGLEDKVIFTGFVDEDDIPALMAGARVFAMPSFWEGFGIPVVEAMAVGTPVVVSNRGSLPEIVDKAGVIVDPDRPEDIARGIKEAIKSKEILVKKGLAQAKKFDWNTCAKKTLEVLEGVKSGNL